MKDFWTNSIWYIALMFISAVLLSYVLFKSKKRKKDLGFFFAVLGLTFLIETVIYVFLRAYEYYPRIIPNSPKNDGVIGNIVSQFSVSTAALFICVFEIPFKGIVLAGAIFYLIGKLFLVLGIYQTYWYKSWITFVSFIILFVYVKNWYNAVVKSSTHTKRYMTIFLGVIALYLPTTNWIGILSGYVASKKDILIDPFISHAIVAIPKYFIQINIVYFLNKNKVSWIWNAAAVAVLIMGDVILYYTNVIYVKEGWLLIYSGISIFTTYLYVHIMNKLLYD